MKTLDPGAVLLVVDMQLGFDDPSWGPRNNPELEANMAALLAAWRLAGAPVMHAHHDSPAPTGRLRKGSPGHGPKPEAQPRPGERTYCKRVNSAFIGTDLEADLRAGNIRGLVVVGLTTNHCVSTTARMARNLGFETWVVADATAAFARPHLNGRHRSADEVHDAALSDLQDEFAAIVDTRAMLGFLRNGKAACV